MPRPKSTVPKFCLHRPSGQGYARFGTECRYFGPHNAPETRRKFETTVAEWLANGRRFAVPANVLTVDELFAAFTKHAKEAYRRPDGSLGSQCSIIKSVTEHVLALYTGTACIDFGPTALRAVRERFVAQGWTRGGVNRGAMIVRQAFRFGVSREMLPASALERLRALEPLRRGRCDAPEGKPVRPVPVVHIDAVLGLVSRPVAALIRLQLLTGARAGELVGLRPIDIDCTGEIWTAKLDAHKTAWHGHERTIYFGPQAKSVLSPFLFGRPVNKPLFSPKEAERERRDQCPTHRHQPVAPPKTDRTIGDTYDVPSYRRAIHRACAKAKVPQWSVHQLRHNAATAIRKELGLEAARIILGHRSPAITAIYAEVDQGKAVEAARKLG